MRVDWYQDRVRAVYEDMVSTAFSLKYADDLGEFQRIDGSGGDGGRDVHFRTAHRLDILELKSFSGRLGNEQSRRQQVQDSLLRAAALQPDTWTLVVPIDPTPGELRWFDRLRARVDFPLAWFGRTELDGLMSAFPSVPRYFVDGAADEVLSLLREVGLEQAAVADLHQAMDRLRGLAERFDEISPHYRLDFARQGPTTTVVVMPRYPGAEDDRPIVVSARFALPDTDLAREVAAQVNEFFAYGGEVEIPEEFAGSLEVDAPGGLGRNMEGGKVVLRSHEVPTGLPLDGRLRIVTADGSPGPSIPIRFHRRVTGARGVTLEGNDFSGAITIRLRGDLVAQSAKINLSFSPPAEALPAVLRALYRFTTALTPQHRLSMSLGSLDVGEPMEIPPDLVDIGPDPGLAQLLDDLDLIQGVTSTPFPVPEVVPAEDVATIRRVAALLRGEVVQVPASQFTTDVYIRDDVMPNELFGQDPIRFASVAKQSTATILGHIVPLGVTTTHAVGRLLDPAAVRSALEASEREQPVTLVIRVEPGTKIEMSRGDRVNENADEATTGQG